MDISDNNKFFRFVWRFNAIVIAGGAVLCILLGSFAAIKILKSETRTRHVTNLVNLGNQTEIKDELVVGSPRMMAGTDYAEAPLYRVQSYDMSYYSKSSGRNDVNFLFFDGRTGESKWLMPTTAQLFIAHEALVEKPDNITAGKNKVIGIVYTVVEKDTNGDSRLTEKDKITVSYSLPNGSEYKKLVEDIERLHGIEQIGDNRLIVFYEKNKETISEIYELPSLERISQKAIPKINP
ncbi:MAG: hypothetical protein EPN97_00520 [Alphaproteobacteria bacterium]|nr:MAG: hypothetical protein EPN97_00520 [Alphaproteobacteria bacterium]